MLYSSTQISYLRVIRTSIHRVAPGRPYTVTAVTLPELHRQDKTMMRTSSVFLDFRSCYGFLMAVNRKCIN